MNIDTVALIFPELKDEQLDAAVKIQAFLSDPNRGMFLLLGYAGTGKTFTLSRIVEKFQSLSWRNSVAMTAPTNKAVKVLKDSASTSLATSNNVDFLTIHKLLSLKPKVQDDGKIVFQDDKWNDDWRSGEKKGINSYRLLIIDEVSMLNDELFDLIVARIEKDKLKVKIIFMGDPCQIPPVRTIKDADPELKECKPMQASIQEQFNIEVAQLTTIRRQGLDSGILSGSIMIREQILKRDIALPYFDGKRKDLQYLMTDSQILPVLSWMFNSSEFKQDANHAKVIAWTNAEVSKYNSIVRNFIYHNAGESKLLPGECLVANSLIKKDENILFKTSDEFTVCHFNIVSDDIDIFDVATGKKYKEEIFYYETTVEYLDDNLELSMKSIDILHERSYSAWNKILDALLTTAKHKMTSFFWKKYYQARERFADVKYNYAITGHKSQGSTYTNVMVIWSDMVNNPAIVERNRILYTTMTRAKENLFIVI